jgi:hypothetical protein
MLERPSTPTRVARQDRKWIGRIRIPLFHIFRSFFKVSKLGKEEEGMKSILTDLIQKTLEEANKLLDSHCYIEAMQCAEIATELSEILNALPRT